MAKLALVGLLATGCTIVGAGAGALTGSQIGNGDHTGRDALVGGGIGAAVDAVIVALYYFVESSNTVGGR